MPGGIGPIDRETARACRSGGANGEIPEGCGEAEIFYRLSLGRVCYSYPRERLYFTDSGFLPVRRILLAAMRGLGKSPEIEQLHLDPHQVFAGACRVPVRARDADAILAALRLAGAEVILLS